MGKIMQRTRLSGPIEKRRRMWLNRVRMVYSWKIGSSILGLEQRVGEPQWQWKLTRIYHRRALVQIRYGTALSASIFFE
jgi:hypothetical protein